MATDNTLNYDEMIWLDAESLAEQGMLVAYERIREEFRKRGIELSPLEEIVDDINGTYHVVHNEKKYCIYNDMNDRNSWSNATVALFEIVNSQLHDQELKFYAINSGNDLGGMILTEIGCAQARRQLNLKMDWPYFPQLDDDWVG
jgi:hypothetical protein